MAGAAAEDPSASSNVMPASKAVRDAPLRPSAAADLPGPKKKRKSDEGSNTEDEDATKAPYECRFCTMRFAKSQALGGHMNRHRQEREKEQYQQARELVNQMQQQPRAWPGCVILPPESNRPGAAALPSRLNQLSVPPRPDSRPQVDFNMGLPTPPSTQSLPVLPSSNYYLQSGASSNNLQNSQWLSNVLAHPSTRLGQTGVFNATDSTTMLQGGAMGSEFLQSILQPRQEPGNYGGQGSNNFSSLFPRSSGGSGQDLQGLQYGLDNTKTTLNSSSLSHQPHRMGEALRQQTSNASLSNVMQNVTGDVKPASSFAGVPNLLHVDPGKRAAPGATYNMVQTPGTGMSQFNPPQFGGNASYSMTQASFGGHTYNHPGGNYAGDFPDPLQDLENLAASMQYNTGSRPSLAPPGSGSVSGSFNLPSGHEGGSMFMVAREEMRYAGGKSNLTPLGSTSDSDQSFGLPLQGSNMESHQGAAAQGGSQGTLLGAAVGQLNTSVDQGIDAAVDSLNVTPGAESAVTGGRDDVSALSAPARYHSTEFSSHGSPEWRPMKHSPPGPSPSSPPSDETNL